MNAISQSGQERAARSLWLDQALETEAGKTPVAIARGKLAADVVIVGGGFTGLWAAVRLKEAEPSLSVILIEGDICGGGASGRNGGFALSWWAKLLTLEKFCGPEDAIWLAQASQDAVNGLENFCRKHAPRADFRKDGWLWVATSGKQVNSWMPTLNRIEQLAPNPFDYLEPAQVQARAGSARHIAGVLERNAATLHPGFLVRALRKRVQDIGVTIYEESPMQSMTGNGPVIVKTPQAAITADKVVLATNAWGIREPEIRKAIVVASSDIVASPPIQEWLVQKGLNNGVAISDSRAMVHYYRTTTDGRMVFGKGGGSGTLAYGAKVGAQFEGHSGIADKAEHWLRWTYPDISMKQCATSWRGPIDKSSSGLPFFGTLSGRPNIFFAVGFSGNGVGPCAVAAHILTSLVLGRRDRWAACGLVRPLQRDFPPEPFRYIGGKLVTHAVARLDAANDAGHDGSWLVNKLAALAPTALSPTKPS